MKFKAKDHEAVERIITLLDRNDSIREDINDDITILRESGEISNYLAIIIANSLGWDSNLIISYD